jgi:hypothetical protein
LPANNVLLIAPPDDEVHKVTRALGDLQASFRLKPGITVLVQEVAVADLRKTG